MLLLVIRFAKSAPVFMIRFFYGIFIPVIEEPYECNIFTSYFKDNCVTFLILAQMHISGEQLS